MQSPYFISVDPSPAKVRMFFGRCQELSTLQSWLLKGDSVLLNGERRIGKTFLLTMVRQGSSAKEGHLLETMLDRSTASTLGRFYTATAGLRWVYVDLLVVQNLAGFYFRVLSGIAEGQDKRYAASYPIDTARFIGDLTLLSEDLLRKGERVVVLVDEVEKLLELEENASALACLKAAIQQCAAVDFILAGDVKPHQESREFANLKGALQTMQLPPLDLAAVKSLVQVPMAGSLGFEDQVLVKIHELTGGRPCLIQILCGHLCDLAVTSSGESTQMTQAEFDRLWNTELRGRVFESFGAPLREFFDGVQGDEQVVLAFLAHHPLASEEELADALYMDAPRIRKAIRFLLASHRIKTEASGHRLSAQIMQDFGARFVPCPTVKVRKTMLQRQRLADLLRGESVNVEYKSSLRWDMKESKENSGLEKMVTKTVAGFLNSEGGTLLIGVADNLTVLGIKPDLAFVHGHDLDGFERHLHQLLANALGIEFTQFEHVSFEEHEDKTVCIILVEPSPKPVYLTDKGVKEFWVRDGNATKALDMEDAHAYISMHW